jgi:hypothetical protein
MLETLNCFVWHSVMTFGSFLNRNCNVRDTFIRRGQGCLSLVSGVFCQVGFSASGWSLIQRIPGECDMSACDREASIMWRPWTTRGCCCCRRRCRCRRHCCCCCCRCCMEIKMIFSQWTMILYLIMIVRLGKMKNPSYFMRNRTRNLPDLP